MYGYNHSYEQEDDKLELKLIAPCIFGTESVVGRELKKLGYNDQRIDNGRVTFSGDAKAICRTNIWLRSAERVLLKLGEFKALSFEELFERTKELPWHDWLPEDAEFPVDVTTIDSKLFSVSDCQAIIKKAVVEKMKLRYKCDWFEETGARYKIQASILKDMVTVSFDTTGTGLHKRGYRKLVGEAPLKETLASAMIQVSRWRDDRALIDPFCGTGTIPIEACMIARNIAPGLNREFVSQGWSFIGEKLWNETREEARDNIRNGEKLYIHGSDISEEALSLARYHAKQAEVEKDIHLQQMDVKDISSNRKYGFIICNPPYGERLGDKREVERLYADMGKVFAKFDTWSYYILSSHPEFERLFNRSANKKRKLYNGMIMCNYYQYFGPPPRESARTQEE
jgi:putative N6-adenine-specific DNA methylase